MIEDEADRLVEADALLAKGDLRGELIVVQCELARGGFDRARGAALRQREHDLLREHGKEWTAPLEGLALQPVFRGGFVDEVTIDAKTFAAREAELWDEAPRLRWIRVTGLSCRSDARDLESSSGDFHRIEPQLAAIFASRRVRWFEAADAEVLYPYTGEMSVYERSHSFADDILAWMADHRIEGLRGLGFATATEYTLASIARRDDAAQIAELELSAARFVEGWWNEPSPLCGPNLRPRRLKLLTVPDELAGLLRLPFADQVVDLTINMVEPQALEGLPKNVRRLEIFCHDRSWQLAQLVRMSQLDAIEELTVRGGSPYSWPSRGDVDLLPVARAARLPSLRALRFERLRPTDLAAFLETPFARRLEAVEVADATYCP